MAPLAASLLCPAGVHRVSVEDVYAMAAAGPFEENTRIELVRGVLVDMVPIGADHDGAVEWLTAHFALPVSRKRHEKRRFVVCRTFFKTARARRL
jgi:hypothetical protein